MHTTIAPYDRFRESDNTSFTSSHWKTYGPGSATATYPANGSRVGEYRNMSDRVTPAFKELSAAGLIVNSPVSSLKCTFSEVQRTGWGHHDPKSNPATTEWKGETPYALSIWLPPLGFTPPAELIDVSSLVTAAVTKAMANVNKSGTQGLAFLGELNDTIGLLRHPFAALTKFFRKPLKKTRSYGRVSRGGNRHGYGYSTSWQINRQAAIGAIASQYLAFQFGVLPLMHDIEGIVTGLVFRRPEVMRETARGKMNDSRSHVTYNYCNGGHTSYTESVDETVDVRAGVLYASRGNSSTRALGVRLADIPSAAWELMPWSFVIDWFANVGDVVAGITATYTNDLLTQWVTIRRTQVLTRSITGVLPFTPWVNDINCHDSDRCIYETYTRTPMSPASGMGFALNLSLNRAPTLSAISLLIQQLTGGRQ